MTDNDKAPEWMTEDWLATMARTPGDNQPLAREILRLRAKLTQLDEHLPTVERLTQDLAKTEAELSTLAAELAKLREHADHDAGEILRLGGELADIKACDGPIAQAEAYGESMRHENDGLRAEVERLNIEIGRHPATRAWVTSGIRAIEEATSRADAAIRDRNEFAASELLAAIDAWAIAANVDWIKVVKDRAAELRQAASACPECDGSGTVEKCDWPGEHANRHQEPCPRGCKAAGAEVCGRCGATSAKDAEAKCRPEGDSCPGVGLWWRKAAGAAAPVEPNLLDKPDSAARDWPEDFADENGNYSVLCSICQQWFLGYKRRVACKVCATKEARPEPAAEPSRFADAVRNAREAAEGIAMKPTGASDVVLAGITMWLCDAVEALAREHGEAGRG